MGFPCTICHLIIEQYLHNILPLSSLGTIYDMDSFTIPCHHGVVVLIVIVIKCDVQLNLVSFHALILITWHGWLPFLTHKDNLRTKHFFQVYCIDYQKIIWVIHVRKENLENAFSNDDETEGCFIKQNIEQRGKGRTYHT
jgi:hypothetical protein